MKYVRASDGQGTQTLELELSLMQTTKKPFTEEKTEEKTTNKHTPTHTHGWTFSPKQQQTKHGTVAEDSVRENCASPQASSRIAAPGGTLEKTKEGRSSCESRRR
jgi:hypothetical protein